jgi:hypothetical protein
MRTHLSHIGLAVVLVATCAIAIDAPALELRFRAADTTSKDSASDTPRSRSTSATSESGADASTAPSKRERATSHHTHIGRTGRVLANPHRGSRIEVRTSPGQSYVAWPGGVVVSGTGGHCPTVGVRWIPGHWEYRDRRVWVPDRWETKRHPPVYEQRLINDRMVPVLVRAAWYEKVRIPGYYTVVTERVWVPGYYAYY